MSWDDFISEGIAAVQRSDHAAAEKAFKNALKYAKQNFERTDNRLALTLSLLGHMYFHNVDFRAAEILLEQSLRLHWESDSLNEQCVLMDVYSLGEIKLALGKRVDACRLYERVIETLRPNAAADESGVLSQAVHQFEQLLERNKAMLSYTERLELVQPELIESILAAAAASEQAVEEAAAEDEPPVSQEEFEARQHELTESGTHSVSEVWSLQFNNGLSGLDDDEKESWVSAYLNLESALRLARRLFAPGDERLTKNLKALADASARLRLFEQAETLYRDAIASAKEAAPDAVPHLDALRLSLALFYVDIDRFTQAKKIFDTTKVPDYLQRAPEGKDLMRHMDKAMEKINIYQSSQNLLRQAQAAEEEKDFEKASRLVNTALSTLRQGFPPNHPENARLLRYRSSLLHSMGQSDQSVELVQRAERIEKTNDTICSDWEKITHDLPKPDREGIAV